MEITNRFDLPDVVVAALTSDTYTKGDSVRSITTLIDSPQIRLLQEKYDGQITQDVTDFLWSRLGTAAHDMFEQAATQFASEEVISEERLFVDRDDWKISGAIDLQQISTQGVIVSDYKVTSVWSVVFDKSEWHSQLNAYAWLVRHAKQLPVERLRIIAVLRDWVRRKAEEGGNYPVSPITIIDIPLWSDQEQDHYMRDRIDLHQTAEFDYLTSNKPLPECSAQERWQKETKFAAMKKGRVRAIKLHGSLTDATAHVEKLGKGHYVETRKGENTRCEQNWCRVSEWCEQFNNPPLSPE